MTYCISQQFIVLLTLPFLSTSYVESDYIQGSNLDNIDLLNYSKENVHPIPLSDGTDYNMQPLLNTRVINSSDEEDFETICSFANKLLISVSPIDKEIQEVINEHFWEML